MFRFFKLLIPSLVICFWLLVIFAWAAPPQKFPPVSGEIFGAAAPGVRSITVNGKPVAFDANQNFRAAVKLKAGEKYLTLRINYAGLRLIKKYLILRKSAVSSFKVFVPKEKIEKSIQAVKKRKKRLLALKEKAKQKKARPAPAKKIISATLEAVKLPATKSLASEVMTAEARPAPPTLPRTFEYLYVWEFSEGKLLAVKEKKGKYSADIYIPVEKKWLDLKGLSEKELSELIERPLKNFKPKKK